MTATALVFFGSALLLFCALASLSEHLLDEDYLWYEETQTGRYLSDEDEMLDPEEDGA